MEASGFAGGDSPASVTEAPSIRHMGARQAEPCRALEPVTGPARLLPPRGSKLLLMRLAFLFGGMNSGGEAPPKRKARSGWRPTEKPRSVGKRTQCEKQLTSKEGTPPKPRLLCDGG